MRPALLLIMGCVTWLGLYGIATAHDAKFDSLYARLSVNPPTETGMTVCYGFGCRRRLELEFSPRDHAALSGMLAAGRASPAAERAAVAKAVGWFDRHVGPLAGTSRRVARADFRTHDDVHNFDCVDTSTNTTSFLLLLSDWHLLHHHDVDMPRFRGNFLFGQTPHNTAVLVEHNTGKAWSIDMWTTKYGAVADVMPLERWLKEN
jgi:hypothetical protein